MNITDFTPVSRLRMPEGMGDDCFSFDSKICLYDGQTKRIEDLMLSRPDNNFEGDKVFLPSGGLGIIVGIHRSSSPTYTFRVTATSMDNNYLTIEVCAGHLLLTPNLQPIPVAYLNQGDQVLGNDQVLIIDSVEPYEQSSTAMVNLSIASPSCIKDLCQSIQVSTQLFEHWLEKSAWLSSLGHPYKYHAICVNGFTICDLQLYAEFIRAIRKISV
jgi:hypothetical protein